MYIYAYNLYVYNIYYIYYIFITIERRRIAIKSIFLITYKSVLSKSELRFCISETAGMDSRMLLTTNRFLYLMAVCY